jgi:sensor c-di-GMP phosphodiesterase-like protein
MARFNVRKCHFSRSPTPRRRQRRRIADDGRNQASRPPQSWHRRGEVVVDHLPAASESLHAIATNRVQLTGAISRRTLLAWLDTGAVGSLPLVALIAFRSHDGDRFAVAVSVSDCG